MSEFNKFADLMIEAAYQENIKNLGKPMAELMKQSVIQLKPVIEIFFNKGMEIGKAQAVPEGFVLIKDDAKTVVAIERMVEQQVEASGIDSRRLERLDGWKIIEAAVKAQEPAND